MELSAIEGFLEEAAVLVRLMIYDILRQNVSMIRTITASSTRDTDYNALGSYFMAHVIYRLKKMGR